ncbi:MAG: thymidine phosphorylase [Candidatus Aenigmarchaeota archaeon]|nr:thymidine phosphorylase [Candidatus Aenigmarchaeota archaeon]
MKLRVRCLGLDAGGKTIAIINSENSRELGVRSLERIVLKSGSKKLTVVVNVSDDFVMEGDIVVYNEVKDLLKLRNGDFVHVAARPDLESKMYIGKKISGQELSEKEINVIINDVLSHNLNDLELASFVTALHINGLSMNEDYYFAKAFIGSSSERIRFPGVVVDKHSCGGVCGDKTTMILVPIIAAAGLTIPKTSSRAITAPAGTADRVEAVAPVIHDVKRIHDIVKKTNGCMVWGGSLDLAPADDLLIQIEKPLEIDPLIIPSVLAKKKTVGSRYVVIDIPTGPDAKIKTKEDAERIANRFISVGKKVGMHVECVVTKADQPIGFAIGPALEAKEALHALMNPNNAPKDLVDKATSLAGVLLRMVGKGDKRTAEKILFSGKAEKKFREIVKAQGGNYNIKPGDLDKKIIVINVKSKKSGYVSYINNKILIRLAKLAGAPKDKYAGILLKSKLGHKARKGEVVYEIHVENPAKIGMVKKHLKQGDGILITGKAMKMVIEEIDHIRKK